MAGKKLAPLVPPAYVRARFAEVLTPSETSALEALFRLRETAHRFDALMASWIGQDALSPGRLQVLIVLWTRGQPVPQREIVEALKVSRANVSMLVEALQREGHILSEPDPNDRRQVMVSLTPAGTTMTDRLVRETAGKLRDSLALDDRELGIFNDLMARAIK